MDPTFGVAGVVRLGFGTPFGYATALAVTPKGDVVIGGSVSGQPDASLVLKLRSDGAVDPSFGSAGTAKVTSAFPGAPGSPFSVSAIATRTDGRLVLVAGGTDGVHPGTRDVEVLELDQDGWRRSGFGSFVAAAGDARVATLTAGGKLLVAGSKDTPTGSVFALMRFTSAGRLDEMFGGGDGTVTTNFGAKRGRESVNAIVTTRSRRIVLAGEATDNALRRSRFALARYTPAGVLDPTFASRGKLLTRFGTHAAAARVAVTSRAGTVIAAGSGLRSVLMERYRHHGTAVVLDLVNEPNLQWWPQQHPSETSDPWAPGQGGPPACAVARMMATAQTISSWLGHPMLLAAPGTSDLRGPSTAHRRLHTSYTSFVTGVLATLQTINFSAHSRFIWSHHNYIDITENLGAGGASGPNRAAEVRGLLTSAGWSGWRGSRPDVPNIWLTEGGCKLTDASGNPLRTQAQQNDLIRASFARMQGAQGDGAGMEMITNYLMHSVPHYDTGLRDPDLAGGAARLSYYGWQSLPGRF